MTKKAIIFDSSTLISFAMNGLLPELAELKKIFGGKFLITNDVKRETIDKPLTIKRFELEGLKIKQLLNEKIIEMPGSLNIDEKKVLEEAKKILDIANNTFFARDRTIRLIDFGEASCLALSKLLNEKNPKIKNVIAIDERTTRMLCEKPENLKKLFQSKLHTKITSNQENYKFFDGFEIIRSAELIYIAYKKKLVRWGDGLLLDALLYALKFKGCAISSDEIKGIKKL